MSAELATVSFRTETGVTEDESWTVVESAALSKTVPWGTFRWYKGQRRPRLFDAALLDAVRGTDVQGYTLGEVVYGLDGCDLAAARAAVLHLLWRGELNTDLSTSLSDRHELVRPA